MKYLQLQLQKRVTVTPLFLAVTSTLTVTHHFLNSVTQLPLLHGCVTPLFFLYSLGSQTLVSGAKSEANRDENCT